MNLSLKYFLTFLPLLFIIEMNSQVYLKHHTIYYNSNTNQINKQEKQKLDSFLVSLSNIFSAFEITVKGHTDHKGSLSLNENLSKNRANNVFRYLIKKGFRVTDSTLNYYAYKKLIADTGELNNWRNRRVEIFIYRRELNMVKILGITDFNSNKFIINEDSGGVISYDSTSITIVPNSFVYEDGSEVTGDITINYMEYKKPMDFLLGNIPMSIQVDNSMMNFESGGMFKILANQNGKKITLKKSNDKMIQLEMPLKEILNQKFYQFDSLNHHWIDSQKEITDNNGRVILPLLPNNITGFSVDKYIYPNCITGDTCLYFDNMFLKLKYYLTHSEPILFNNPYKSVKNNEEDYKSPYYQIITDTARHTCAFKSINFNNELGKFSDYIWTFEGFDFNNLKNLKQNYTSFIKFIYVGENRFQIKMNDVFSKPLIYNVTGKSSTLHLFKKSSTINKKNNEKYLKQLYEFDNLEIQHDKVLKTRFEISNVNDNLFSDSLNCFVDFYTHFLCDSSERISIREYGSFHNYFNVNKESILKKFNQKKSIFNCNEYKAKVAKFSEIERIKIATKAKFGISSLGMFNCDAVKSIANPKEINALYINKEDGKAVSVITIYVNIENLNGLITYDGHYGYGPYHFVYGVSDKCVLVAVDENLKAYFVSPVDFRKYADNPIGNTVTFILTPSGLLNSKNNLDKIMLK